ncbi:thiolase C-terminal domain-containing protein [Natrinema caseinilyticum]|uniref:thiolase C-terminal domain-containing protein n=1 Tax=Natrinema caseinilyticum TaxID=2961570 RepID=UPI0020C56C93|nr:hypothetical protein [Natrinema caseinilyticum]
MGSTQRVAVTGIGESPIGSTPDMDSINLYATACLEAVDDAGLEKDDIDGLVTGYSLVDPKLMHSTVVADYLGLNLSYNESLRLGGATPFVGVCHAANAIRQGQCENVVIAFGDNRRTGFSKGDGVSNLATEVGHPEFENPFGPMVPSLYALIARKHMAEYGTTAEELATVSVACREHASMRGKGQQTDPIEVEDVLSSGLISSPLHKLECALISDCAGAVVVSSADAAADTRAPVELTGYGEGHGSEYIHRRNDLLYSPAVESGSTAFEMADRTPDDVDVAQLYDCFSITPLMLLEDLGFCEKGEGGSFVRERGITVDGDLPVNTHGGELSYAGAGVFHILEAARQIRGEAAETQVETDVALAHGVGGVLSTNATLLMEAW